MTDHNKDYEEEGGIQTLTRAEVRRPKLYMVIMHNDDYTTMEFVTYVLKKFFGKTSQESEAIMLGVHTNGQAMVGLYTHEIAESKADKVIKAAESEGHPLRCSIEAES
ncbi:MAG: ATP-dependent Clp protease adaptor ClpS [Bacteriovoracaceae bacterium]|nr:ATP-dependent Clp protease adaptor ClpS [Bacteriovoracaceae bacterium]